MSAPASPSSRAKWTAAVLLLVLVTALLGTRGYSFMMQRKHDPARGNPPNSVVILTAEWCSFCDHLRASLELSNIPFRQIDIEDSSGGARNFC